MKIVNLTSHNIVYQKEDGTRISYPPSGDVCRVSTSSIPVKSPIQGHTAINRHYGFLEGFPNEPDTVYIVSNPCLDFAPPDAKVVAPANGYNELCYRDEDGQVEAVSNWVVPSREDRDVRKATFIEAANIVEQILVQLKFENETSYPPGGSLRGPKTKLGWVRKVARELRAWAGIPQEGVGYLQKPPLKKNKNVIDR